MATLMLLSLASSMRAASWSGGMGAVMVFSLGSGGSPTVRCFWCASKSEQAYRETIIRKRCWEEILSSVRRMKWSICWVCSAVPNRAPPPSSSACRRSSWWGPTVWGHLPSRRGQSAGSSLWSLYRASGCPSPYPWWEKNQQQTRFKTLHHWWQTLLRYDSSEQRRKKEKKIHDE